MSGCNKAGKSSSELKTGDLKSLGSGKGVSAEDVSKAKAKAEGYRQPSGK